jgi:hypothetical protein
LPPLVDFRVSSGSIDHVTPYLKSTFVRVEVMARHLLANKKLRKDLKLKTLEDHQ